MSQAARDNNRIATGLSFDSTNSVTEPLRVDASNNRLIIDISGVTNNSPSAVAIVRDDNRIPVCCGVTDDTSQTITPLIIDSRNGLLYMDVLIE